MKARFFPHVTMLSFHFIVIVLCISLFSTINANAQLPDSTTEKKVDYLERIYFSGENKEGLKIKIQSAIQEIQQKAPTVSLAKQVTFLLNIQDKANTADNACEILDLLSTGIYSIDAADASLQGVRPASDKAKAKSADALAGLTKLSSTSNTLSTNASNLAWSNYLLNGSKSSSITSGASRIANTAGTIGSVANTAGQAAQTAKQLGDVAKSLGFWKKKDKACDDVPKKDIEIGTHIAPASVNTSSKNNVQTNDNMSAVTTTVVTIQSINLSALKTLTDSLRNKSGVQSAEKSYNATASTITIMHSGTTDALADWLDDKFSGELKIVDYSSGKINMAKK